MIDFIDKTTTVDGTPINRANMMALQGFQSQTITFGTNTITETDGTNTCITTFNSNGTITEQFTGTKTIIKTTTFNTDGSITEAVIS